MTNCSFFSPSNPMQPSCLANAVCICFVGLLGTYPYRVYFWWEESDNTMTSDWRLSQAAALVF
jgi:hypothetical protein